ncbi:MAG: peptidylprolyl isomerase, partial [Lachnospiraceae bacterium]|nr:peptidylprolyl isomerase [Lachnospiraceae bacterium]
MKYKKKAVFVAVLAACMLMVTGCGDNWNFSDTKVVFTTGLGKEDVFRIDDEVCTLPELMVYLTTTQNQYEQVYGSEIWNVSLDGVDLEENIKETVLAEVAQIKS